MFSHPDKMGCRKAWINVDEFLLDYLRSGKAWLLIGSGPSSAIGYPSWQRLAQSAVQLCRLECEAKDRVSVERSYTARDYPKVFDDAATLVGMPRLLQELHKIIPVHPDKAVGDNIYSQIARWPIPVYLTTNYDNEILKHLSLSGESTYIEYSNSVDHMSRLLPELSGSVVHLHGDLRSETGLILTSTQYKEILEGPTWEYWRTKMTSVFQMNRVVVIGHSLSDPHIRHVLEAAKQGSGVAQPVCWIAPDVSRATAKEFLEKYRIRVITYDNQDGTHRNLARLVNTISDFVPPRITVHLSEALRNATVSPLGNNAAAPGFFVFNKLSSQNDFEEKRADVLVAALYGMAPKLKTIPPFSLQEALGIAGWPAESPIPNELADHIIAKATKDGLLIPVDNLFALSPEAEDRARKERDQFDHLQQRFRLSIQNRLRRDFPALSHTQANEIAVDIDTALTAFFREGGLTLASTLATTAPGLTNQAAKPTIPTFIIGFMNEASAKYDDALSRQAFSAVSLECFIRSEAVEREYLGRVSQGFFAFHLLGVFGDAASERLRHVKDTVWIVDSSAQIPAVAVGSPSHNAFRDVFYYLTKLGLRFFSTEGLFEETQVHLWFADRVISEVGASSPTIVDAAMGKLPYRKGNLFLEAFISWQAAGNPADWKQYLIHISGSAHVAADAVRGALSRLGIETVSFRDWPGFDSQDLADAEKSTQKLMEIAERRNNIVNDEDLEALHRKTKPEAEVFEIIRGERNGKYNMLSPKGKPSAAWFISQTAVLNLLRSGLTITWQPEAFLRFAATLMPATGEEAAERAFSTLLWTIAQSGLTVLDDRVAAQVFGGVIDQAKLVITEQHVAYDEVLAEKYGTSIEKVMNQVPLLDRPLAALQLANERAQKEATLRAVAVNVAEVEKKRASEAQKELSKVERFRKKLQTKENQAAQRKRKNRAQKKKRK
jgi:hypothetical protein